MDLQSTINCVVLGWKPVTVDKGSRGFVNDFLIFQSTQGVLIFNQLLVAQRAQPVILPPHRLVFASMPLKQLGQQPNSLLLFGPFTFFLRHVLSQTRFELCYLRELRFKLLARSTCAAFRSRD